MKWVTAIFGGVTPRKPTTAAAEESQVGVLSLVRELRDAPLLRRVTTLRAMEAAGEYASTLSPDEAERLFDDLFNKGKRS